jgi:hypothetical protein
MTIKGGGILANLVRTVSGVRRLGVVEPTRDEAGWTTMHNAVTTPSVQEFTMPEGLNALLVIHTMTGQTTGGFVRLEDRFSGGTPGLAHHGKGSNIKSAATATNYVSLFEGVSKIVGIDLQRTDGTHTVRVLPIRV